MIYEKTSHASFELMETWNSRYLSGVLRRQTNDGKSEKGCRRTKKKGERGRTKFLAGLSLSKWLDESL